MCVYTHFPFVKCSKIIVKENISEKQMQEAKQLLPQEPLADSLFFKTRDLGTALHVGKNL